MLKNIHSNSEYLQGGYVHGGPTFNGVAADSGQVRYNPQLQSLQVFNGIEYKSIDQSVTIGLSAEAEAIMVWARAKMKQEANLKEAMDKHPGLKDAYEKFEIMKTLCGE